MADIMRMGEKNPNYLGSFDLYDLKPQELTLTIKDIKDETIVTARGNELVTSCYFVEDYKPMILNPTNKKRLAKLFKSKSTTVMAGKRITIIIEQVKAFGQISDALRIKQTLPQQAKIIKKFNCESCQAELKPFGKMNEEQLADYTKKQYGTILCSVCATEQAKKVKEDEAGADVDK